MVVAVSPSSTRNSTCSGSSDTGSVRESPRSSRTRSATNGRLSAAGLSAAQRQDRVVDQRPQRGQGDEQHEAGEDEGEQEELDDAAEAATATATAPTAAVAVAAPARRLVGLGHVVGGIRVGLEPAAMGLASVAWASAGADRHVVISGVVGWGPGTDPACRVSRASCRMTAAASRSTRARYSSRWWRDGGPPERPRFIGPSRVSATWLLSRSSCRVMVTWSPKRAADVFHPRSASARPGDPRARPHRWAARRRAR